MAADRHLNAALLPSCLLPPLTERGPVPAYQSTKLARAAIFETEKQTHWNKTLSEYAQATDWKPLN